MSFENEKQGSSKKMPMLSSMKGSNKNTNQENAKKKKRAQWNKPNGDFYLD